MTIDAADFGVVADGRTDCTIPLQKAIKAAEEAGTDVECPPGEILLDGSIKARNVRLYPESQSPGAE